MIQEQSTFRRTRRRINVHKHYIPLANGVNSTVASSRAIRYNEVVKADAAWDAAQAVVKTVTFTVADPDDNTKFTCNLTYSIHNKR